MQASTSVVNEESGQGIHLHDDPQAIVFIVAGIGGNSDKTTRSNLNPSKFNHYEQLTALRKRVINDYLQL